MIVTSLPNLNRKTTPYPQFISLNQDVDHRDVMTLNERPNIDHGDNTEASETSPFNNILSLSPLVSSNEIGILAAPRSVKRFRRELTLPTSSVGSNQCSSDSEARSEGTNAAQLWRDRYNHPDFPELDLRLALNMREEKSINPELWQACAGPLVNLPAAGTYVFYFFQGHCEQVAASMREDVDQIPNYLNHPGKLCLLHNVTLHANPETDVVYARMTLQPANFCCHEDAFLKSDLSMKMIKPHTKFFCSTLTASDVSSHGSFSVPRGAVESIFPLLDYSMQSPTQELEARDAHDNLWTFRHIYIGQPKCHLLTRGWSDFVSRKRLVAGDLVLFIRDEKQQLLLGIRRANSQPSSVLSSESMHNGILGAAARAVANCGSFTVIYYPRTSPSEFVIPFAKLHRALYFSDELYPGVRFRMRFETEEWRTRWSTGTITGITELNPMRWRQLQVGWDESTAGERHNCVSLWEIEINWCIGRVSSSDYC